jgi:hypothetical protein
VLDEVDESDADIAWLVYDLCYDATHKQYALTRHKTVYTQFESSLNQITKTEAGEEKEFLEALQIKLDAKLENGDSSQACISSNELL